MRKWYLLMNPEGDGQGGGGAGAAGAGGAGGNSGGASGGGGAGSGGVLDEGDGGNSGGASGGAGAGGSGDGGAGGAAGGDKGAAGGDGGTKVTIPENWRESLSEDLKVSKTIEKYKTVQDLAKAHDNLQKIMGNDKIVIPQKGDVAGTRAALQKLGLPDKIEDYKIEIDPAKTKVDKEFFEGFKGEAHKLGMLPEQSKALVEWFAKVNDDAYAKQMSEVSQKTEAGIAGLKTEWGEAYGENVSRAKAALREFGDEDLKKFVSESGLSNHAGFIKMLAKVGETLKEDKIKGEGGKGGKAAFTPSEAKLRIAEIKSGPAYFDDKHMDHLSVKKEVQGLYNLAYPGKNKPTRTEDRI